MSYLYRNLPTRMASFMSVASSRLPDIIPTDLRSLVFWQKADTQIYSQAGIYCDGTSYVQCEDGAQLAVNSDWQLGVWIYPSTDSYETWETVVSKDSGDEFQCAYRLQIFQSSSGNSSARYVRGDGGATTAELLVESLTFEMNTWYFIEIFKDYASGDMTMHIDNNEVGSIAPGAFSDFQDAYFTLGANSDGSEAFKGTIDQLGIWNRLLTPEDEEELYNEGNGLAAEDLSMDLQIDIAGFWNLGEWKDANRKNYYGSSSTDLAPRFDNIPGFGHVKCVATLNDSVTEWADQSVQLNDLLQTDINKTAYYDATNIQNGYGGLAFQGLDDVIGAGIPLEQPTQIFVVAQVIDTSGVLISGADTAVRIISDGGGFLVANAGGTELKITNDAAVRCWMILFNGSSSNFVVDRFQSDNGDAGNTDMNGFYVGAESDGANSMIGRVLETFGYSRELTTNETIQIWNYLQDKFATF